MTVSMLIDEVVLGDHRLRVGTRRPARAGRSAASRGPRTGTTSARPGVERAVVAAEPLDDPGPRLGHDPDPLRERDQHHGRDDDEDDQGGQVESFLFGYQRRGAVDLHAPLPACRARRRRPRRSAGAPDLAGELDLPPSPSTRSSTTAARADERGRAGAQPRRGVQVAAGDRAQDEQRGRRHRDEHDPLERQARRRPAPRSPPRRRRSRSGRGRSSA